MGELLRLFLESIQFLWPLRLVEQWEAGGYYIFGRWHRLLAPGMYPIIPWFCDVKTISIAEAIIGTGRQDITLGDGTVLSFAATATVKVTDPFLALNSVDDYQETTKELLSSVLAEKLAAVDAERILPDKRKRLMSDLRAWVAEEGLAYGIEFRKVRFTSFLTNVKTHRHLIDQTTGQTW